MGEEERVLRPLGEVVGEEPARMRAGIAFLGVRAAVAVRILGAVVAPGIESGEHLAIVGRAVLIRVLRRFDGAGRRAGDLHGKSRARQF